MTIFDLAHEQAVIRSVAATLDWDQETYMPPAANSHRANQLSWLTAKAHEMATSSSWQKALEDAEQANDFPSFQPHLDPSDLMHQASGESPQTNSYLQHLQTRYL